MTIAAGIEIAATGAYVPDHVLTNQELGARFGVDEQWILERTGIESRHVAGDDQATSDLGAAAVEVALAGASLDVGQLDLVVCATSTPDWPQPATAAAIHGKLGMRRTSGSFDVDAVCSGFVYALHTGAALLASQPDWSTVAVVGADCYSRTVDRDNRATAVLFGDGAGAVLLRRSARGSAQHVIGSSNTGIAATNNSIPGIVGTAYGTEFALHDTLIVPGGGSREPLTSAGVAAKRGTLHMNGKAVREFASGRFGEAIAAACTNASIEPADLSLVIPHQSNLRIIEHAAEQLGIPMGLVHTTVHRFGNTAAASIPMALDDARRAGRLERGRLACIVGYGGGLTWAAAIIRL